MPIDITLTEQKIQRVLGGFIASPKYRVDGLFVFGWESDKLIWTKAGYIYEFEIKISRQDYLNDFRHKVEKHLLLNSALPDESTEAREADLFGNLLKEKRKRYPQITTEQAKNMMKSVGDRMPNYFYYAVPEGLLEPDEVPPYAGLIYITTYKGGFEDQPDKWLHHIKIVRKAPQLHKTKYTDAELNLSEKFYYNMKTWQHNYREQVEKSLMYRQRLQDELNRKGIDKSYLEMADALKEAERRAEFAEHNVSTYKQINYNLEDGANYHRIESRMFFDLIKELKPDFDYREFTKEVDKKYKERYPKKK